MLAYRHSGELARLVEAQADPSSPAYRHFLTRSQFDAYFSPAAADYARAAATLRAGGFRIVGAPANRLLVRAAGRVGDVERFFGTHIDVVAQTGHGERLVNVLPAKMPQSLRGLAAGAVGLDGLVHMRPANERGPRGGMTPAGAHLGILFGPDGGYGPLAYAEAYGFPTSFVTSGLGEGAGVVIDADFLDTDLASFLSYFKITRTGPPTTRVLVDGGPPSGLTPDSVETTLDVETITGLAPGVSLYVYEIPSLDDQSIIDGYNQVVSDHLVGGVNSSFGGCETEDTTLPALSNEIALQGAAVGITFHASSGDGGAFSCPAVGVSSPASDPYFVAVGGTSLYENPTTAKVVHEFAWSGSGGGFSSLFGMPGYQTGVKNAIPGGRNVPDVAFDADPDTGASFYFSGLFEGPIGGTSLASPIFGAGLALANALTGDHAGFVNPRIYMLYKHDGTSHDGKMLFRDITFGSNGYFSAEKGYDDVTGLGALNFTNTSTALK
jgi:subtilase family serine protease